MGKKKTDYNIKVAAQAFYLEEQSDPGHDRYVFAYTIRIANEGPETVQLEARHWVITAATGAGREVKGEGVVGEQPTLEPGQAFEYTSGCILKTQWGTMHGTYQMVRDGASSFEAEIAPFLLAAPSLTATRTMN